MTSMLHKHSGQLCRTYLQAAWQQAGSPCLCAGALQPPCVRVVLYRSDSAEKKSKAPISWKAWKGPGEPDTPRENGHGRPRKRSSDHGSRERHSKERKGRDQERSGERSKGERPVRAMPVASRRAAHADSPPRRRILEMRSPSRCLRTGSTAQLATALFWAALDARKL